MHRHADHRTRIALFALVLGTLLATLSVTTVGAANFVVTVDHTTDDTNTCATSGMDACSLRDAISFANTHTGATDLTTITLPGILAPYALTNGRADVQSNVTINGAGTSATVINGSVSDRIFTIGLGKSVTFNNLTLSNGHDTLGGGGAFASSGTVVLNNSVVSNNSAINRGGGISSTSGLLALNNSVVSNNSAVGYGGGVYVGGGGFTATNSQFTGNQVTGGAGAPGSPGTDGGSATGGAIAVTSASSFSVTGSRFSGNSATGGTGGTGDNGNGVVPAGSNGGGGGAATGGAIAATNSYAVTGSVFTGNSATGGGGGGGTGDSFNGFEGPGGNGGGGGGASGGAVSKGGGTLTLTNSTFFADQATGGGGGNGGTGGSFAGHTGNGGNGGNGGAGAGGAVSNTGSANIGNVTIAANSASGGGGGSGGTGPNPGTPGAPGTNGTPAGGGLANTGTQLRAINTILSANTVGPTTGNCSGAITDDGHNLEFTTNTCLFAIAVQHGDPNLDTLKDNGGPTQTLALLPGSAAKDTADPNACAAPPTGGKDQRGFFRRSDRCSIGAFEADVAVPNPVPLPPRPGPTPVGVAAPIPAPSRSQPGGGGIPNPVPASR